MTDIGRPARLEGAMLRVGDRVLFDEQTFTVVGYAGTRVRLADASGVAQVVLLGHLLASPGFALLDTVAPAARVEPVGLLDGLPEAVVARAQDWERHVLEVQTGLPPGAPAYSTSWSAGSCSDLSLATSPRGSPRGACTRSGISTPPRSQVRPPRHGGPLTRGGIRVATGDPRARLAVVEEENVADPDAHGHRRDPSVRETTAGRGAGSAHRRRHNERPNGAVPQRPAVGAVAAELALPPCNSDSPLMRRPLNSAGIR